MSNEHVFISSNSVTTQDLRIVYNKWVHNFCYFVLKGELKKINFYPQIPT